MPDPGLPVRKQYVITRVTAVINANGSVPTSVATSITLPPTPEGRVGERDLLNFLKSLVVPATDGVRALRVAESQPGAQPKQAPAAVRVKIQVSGQVVAPKSQATPGANVLGWALGDGSVTAHGRLVVQPSPTGDPRMARRRPGLPPEK